MSVVKKPDLKANRLYTYEEYALWDDGNRYELIDGVPYMMAAPSLTHQEILGELFVQFRAFLKGKPCRVFMAPGDVRLNVRSKNKPHTVVQPDLYVVCDGKKLENGKHCAGAPEFVLEILSPSSRRYDTVDKLKTYKRAGVREYWLVDPEAATVLAAMLQPEELAFDTFGELDVVPVKVLPGLEINLGEVFGASMAAE